MKGNVFTGNTFARNGEAGFLIDAEPQPLFDPFLLDEDPVTKDAWPMPSPQEPEKSLWARIWDAVRNPWVEL